MKFKNILITGGAGYAGSRMVPQLLEMGYKVTVYDILYYPYHELPDSHHNLKIVEGDIRDIAMFTEVAKGMDVVLHLACISNDVSFELDEELSTSVNLDAFEPMVIAAKKQGIKRFIYASTSSVYGVSDSPNVTEDHPLIPLTLYNQYKGECEPFLFKHTDENFTGVVFRPATLCGYAPRQRLDLSVNILTNLAVNKGAITVFGGEQLRPNLHVQDYADLCKVLLEAPDEKIADQTFNCGYQNMSIMEIAQTVKKVVEEVMPELGDISIEVTPSEDKRSYHINSDKIFNVLGFKPRLSIEDAIKDLCASFKAGKLPNSLDDERYFNVKRMKLIEAN